MRLPLAHANRIRRLSESMDASCPQQRPARFAFHDSPRRLGLARSIVRSLRRGLAWEREWMGAIR